MSGLVVGAEDTAVNRTETPSPGEWVFAVAAFT